MDKVERIEKYKEARKNPKGLAEEALYHAGSSLLSGPNRRCSPGSGVGWKLPFFRDGKRILLDIRDLDEFIDRNKQSFGF